MRMLHPSIQIYSSPTIDIGIQHRIYETVMKVVLKHVEIVVV
jgi:hypothetical protein